MKKFALYFAWFLSLASTAGSLAASLFFELTPCNLCWYQRIFMFPLVIIIGVGLWRKTKDLIYFVLPLSLLGLGFAAYHNLLQLGVFQEKITVCSIVTPCVESGPLVFGLLSLPFLSLLSFVLISAGIIFSHFYRRE